ncbi:AraC family transcriptional regulator [Olivibacter sp. SDN3]|uniref:AraC family transcriptional regulator n=1 Tax=Olivibacter sp. SDN3 TaxID=2764720 RepID=UPI001651697D|nr:AraC family transcriptional regulator [Olivibacter sp. SDN3]QNL48308.1 AraC family transcriptional regulator [Olivibacter sp. SDN3]
MLKASEEILRQHHQSFLLREFGREAFNAPYHFHQEYELTYITEGIGKRYVGSHMADFKSGDLVLLGPHLPHCWKLDPADSDHAKVGALVLQFTRSSLGEDLLNKDEFAIIKRMLDKSIYGISFGKKVQEEAAAHFALLECKDGFRRLMAFLELLYQLALTKKISILAAGEQPYYYTATTEQARIHAVWAYIVENFRKEVSLKEAASIASMTSTAFCKFFKKNTRKTFIETIMEYRLNYATNQLIQTNKPIAEIAFDSGFSDVSHFYRSFKKKTGISPLSYRKTFVGELNTEERIT